MKKFFHVILLFPVLNLLFSSCEYEPVGVYERHVNKDIAPPDLQIVELNLNIDTLIISNTTTVKFRINTNYSNVQAVRLLVDSIEIGKVPGNTGEILLYPNSLSGFHKIVMEVYTGSETGSIAEVLGAEGYVFSKSWTLLVRGWYGGMESNILDGILHLQWKDYDASFFQKYLIYKYVQFTDYFCLDSFNISEFTDSSYAGEMAVYKIRIKNSDGGVFDYNFDIGYDYKYIPKLSLSVDSLSHYYFSWPKTKLYNAVASYNVFLGYNWDDYHLVKSTDNLDDTTYLDNEGLFGDLIYVRLRVVPKRQNVQFIPSNYYLFENILPVQVGYKFPVRNYLNDMFPVNGDEFVYTLTCDSLVRYSINNMSIVDKAGREFDGLYSCNFANLQASPSGKYLTANLGYPNKIMFASSDNLKSYIAIDQRTITSNTSLNPIPVSDVGTGLIADSENTLIIYDFLKSEIIGRYFSNSNVPISVNSLKISVNGDYFIMADDSLRLIQIKDTLFKQISVSELSGVNLLYEFDAINPGQFVAWDGALLKIKSCENSSTIYEIPVTEMLMDIDFRNNEILTWTSGLLIVRSLTDGLLKDDIPTNYTPASGLKCYLLNHTVIHPAGLMYFIK